MCTKNEKQKTFGYDAIKEFNERRSKISNFTSWCDYASWIVTNMINPYALLGQHKKVCGTTVLLLLLLTVLGFVLKYMWIVYLTSTFIALGWAMNIVFFLVFYQAYCFHIDIEKYSKSTKADLETTESSIEAKFAILKKDVIKQFDNIIGHKLWADNKTYKLFEALLDDADLDKSKWLMINFLKKIIERSHEGKYQIHANMKIYEYSDFLNANIDHANDIKWLISPSDFFGILLPEFIVYILIDIGQKNKGYKIVLHDNSLDVDQCFDSKMDCTLYRKNETIKVEEGKKVGELRSDIMQQYLRPICICAGIESLLENMNMISLDVEKLYKETVQEGFGLPHIEAFRLSGSEKERILCLGGNLDTDDISKIVKSYWTSNKTSFNLALMASCQSEKCPEITSCLHRLKNINEEVQKNIISNALDLFLFSCERHFEIKGYGDEKLNDIGIYDEKIKVVATNNMDGTRHVVWSYDDTELPQLLSDLAEASSRPYQVFKDLCVEMIRIGD